MFKTPPIVVVELPPMRSFWVLRNAPSVDLTRAKLETITIDAHALSFEQGGVLAFVTYIIVDNTLVSQFSRAVRSWIDFGIVEPVVGA